MKKKEIRKYTEEEIRDAFTGYMMLHSDNAEIKLALEHYTFLEIKEDGISTQYSAAAEDVKLFEELLSKMYETRDFGEEEFKKLDTLRNRVIDIQEQIAGFADRFAIYEYVFNRLEYAFEERDTYQEDLVLKKTLEFIFETDDNMIVNTRLLSVIGQLPVRMTKNHLCDLVMDGCKVYNGSEKKSFDAFLMNLREASGIGEISNFPEFSRFKEALDEFESANIRQIDKENFERLNSYLSDISGDLVQFNDVYTMLIAMINCMYINFLARDYTPEKPESAGEYVIIRGTHDLFTNEGSDVWETYVDSEGDDYNSRLEALSMHFEDFMGRQEINSQRAEKMYSVLESIASGQAESLAVIYGDTDIVKIADYISKLSGSSEYMRLSEDTISLGRADKKAEEAIDTADQSYIESQAGTFIIALKDRLKESDRRVSRAIMASVIEKLPVFFTDAKEVAGYISDAIKYCDDENEKQACLNSIMMIVENG